MPATEKISSLMKNVKKDGVFVVSPGSFEYLLSLVACFSIQMVLAINKGKKR